jgi:type II secretion system protein N
MVTMTPDRWRRLQRAGIYSGFGLVIFIIALYMSFPYDRAKQAAVGWISKNLDMDAEIGSAGPAFGLAVAFQDIRLRTRPITGKPTRLTIESAKVSLSPFSLLTASKSIRLVADAFGGKVAFDFHGTPGKKAAPFAIELHASDISASDLPGLKEAINLVLSGTLKLDGEVRSETGKLADAKGSISFACADCVAGDGKTPLRVAGSAFLSGGLTLPRVRLGQLNGNIAIDKGTAKLQGVETKSPDGEASLEGDVGLRDPFGSSAINLYLRFKLNDAFLQKAASLGMILQTAAAAAKRPDGAYGLCLGGRMAQWAPPRPCPTSPITSGSGGITQARPSNRMPVTTPPPPPAPPPPPPPAAVPTIDVPPPPPPPPAAEPPPPPPPPPSGGVGGGWRAPPSGGTHDATTPTPATPVPTADAPPPSPEGAPAPPPPAPPPAAEE